LRLIVFGSAAPLGRDVTENPRAINPSDVLRRIGRRGLSLGVCAAQGAPLHKIALGGGKRAIWMHRGLRPGHHRQLRLPNDAPARRGNRQGQAKPHGRWNRVKYEGTSVKARKCAKRSGAVAGRGGIGTVETIRKRRNLRRRHAWPRHLRGDGKAGIAPT